MQRRGFKRIAMLHSTHNGNVRRYVKHYAKATGLQVTVAAYRRDDYDSMSRARAAVV